MKTKYLILAATLFCGIPVSTVSAGRATASDQKLLLPGWNAKEAADRVLAGLVKVTAPQVRGAHDAEFACVGERAFVVAEVNDVRPSENAGWPFIYSALSVVNLKTLTVEKVVPFARSGQAYANETLPTGSCFVPRIIQKDAQTLRCYFASESPGKRQSQMWLLDFNLENLTFDPQIHKAKLKTAAEAGGNAPGPGEEPGQDGSATTVFPCGRRREWIHASAGRFRSLSLRFVQAVRWSDLRCFEQFSWRPKRTRAGA